MTRGAHDILTLEAFKKQFDVVLRRFFDERIASVKRVTRDVSVLEAVQYVRLFALGGGKRLRPYVAYLGYVSVGRTLTPGIVRSCVAIELFHLFCLLQDDVIDRSAERHGMRTVHEHLRGVLGQHNRVGDLRHIGEGEAVLLGDLLAGWATDVLSELKDVSPGRLRDATQVLRTMRDEVILGQILDVDTMTRPTITSKLIREKLILKSARYSFVRPFQFGVALGGGPRRLMQFAERFGIPLGLAFQTQDDLLDITGDRSTVGKTVLSDIRQHQHTTLTQFILTEGSYIYRKQLLHWFGGDVEPRDHGAILEMFDRSGALAFGRETVARELGLAERALRQAAIRPELRAACRALISAVRQRSS